MKLKMAKTYLSDKELHILGRRLKFNCESSKHDSIPFNTRKDSAISRIKIIREDDQLILKQKVC